MNQDQQLQIGFEHWLRCKWTAGYACVRKDDGYTDKQVQFLWECWKDSAALTATQQAAPSQGAGSGYALAMAVLQSDLYLKLDDQARAQCDAMLSAIPQPAAQDISAIFKEQAS